MRLFVFCAIVAVLLLESSCGGDDPTPERVNDSQDSLIIRHLDSIGVDYQVDTTGIYYYPIELNPTGKSQADGNVLSVYYSLEVLGGQLLNTYDSADGDPIRVKQGANAIYPIGVDRSLSFMKEGEEWVFIIPSKYGFEDYNSALIPENSILVFHPTLEQIQNETDIQGEDNMKIIAYSDSVNLTDTVNYPLNQPEFLTNGTIFKRLAAGSSPNAPQPETGDTLTITYTAYLPYQKNEPFDLKHASNANPFVYSFNTNEVITGLDAGIANMRQGETALLVMPSLLGYRESAVVFPDYLSEEMVDRNTIPAYASDVGPYEVLIFEVSLLQIN
ncbi:MAG: FKBP-type peptidyl-prolyl cis-trans isomerase [Cyclobacteriaceae bacterium]